MKGFANDPCEKSFDSGFKRKQKICKEASKRNSKLAYLRLTHPLKIWTHHASPLILTESHWFMDSQWLTHYCYWTLTDAYVNLSGLAAQLTCSTLCKGALRRVLWVGYWYHIGSRMVCKKSDRAAEDCWQHGLPRHEWWLVCKVLILDLWWLALCNVGAWEAYLPWSSVAPTNDHVVFL